MLFGLNRSPLDDCVITSYPLTENVYFPAGSAFEPKVNLYGISTCKACVCANAGPAVKNVTKMTATSHFAVTPQVFICLITDISLLTLLCCSLQKFPKSYHYLVCL